MPQFDLRIASGSETSSLTAAGHSRTSRPLRGLHPIHAGREERGAEKFSVDGSGA